MLQVPREVLGAVKVALERYLEAVDASEMEESSKRTYREHARRFVRWLDEGPQPGVNVRTKRG